MTKKINKEFLLVALLFLPMISFSIYYVFFVNLGTVFWKSFPEGNEKIKIRGLAFHVPSGLLQTPELARSTGANWIHLKAMFMLKKNGNCFTFPTQETWIRNQIRRAYDAGLRVLLVPFGFPETKSMASDIRLPKEKWKDYYQCITYQTLYWAKIAEEEEVEMFATANEPDRFTSKKEMSKWLQEILPKIKEIYYGKTVVGFYPSIHNHVVEFESKVRDKLEIERMLNINISGYDYIAPCGTPSGIDNIEEMHKLNQKVNEKLKEIYEKWKVKIIFLEINAPEGLIDEFWDTYLKKGMTRSQIRTMLFKEWSKDFVNNKYVDGWFFIEWTPNSFLTFFETNPPDKKYTLGWQTDEVYRMIKEIYSD
jgi:hypothetical protein